MDDVGVVLFGLQVAQKWVQVGIHLVKITIDDSAQPFRRKKPTKAQRKRFRKKSGQMADSFPAYIDGALKADTNLKKGGGMRRRMHGG